MKDLKIAVFFVAFTLILGAFGACGPGTNNPDDDSTTEDTPGTPTPSPQASPTPTPQVYLQTCAQTGMLGMGYTDTLTCLSEVGELQFDFYLIENLVAGDCVHIVADNVDPTSGSGDADLFAYAFDKQGTSYGRLQDHSTFEDEYTCTNEPWNDLFNCPEASLEMAFDGALTVGVAQWAGNPTIATCSNNAPYTLYVAVNGQDTDLSGGPALQDAPLSED